ncbi:hypothetical protein LTR56_000807 [Elasticomyces elasticus]|nr:hypothetical protein LTR22_009036 [Elasticomyces elasticus]KAK3660431.1 hypothetical protein LTR56_000807 [Elasticomyces elasticus]KAK4929176.1 hypothetical protein LTR49_004073 [Elasticomyces elasticus]KAK5765732.1 hypothetical protein LTS12_003992 [Elasticomyces elasticus]
MRGTTVFSFAAAVAPASARIAGIAAPSSIAAGSDFTITIITENYIQSVLDISAAFGFTETVFPDSLGSYLTSVYLGPSRPNILTNISVSASVPASYADGSSYHLTAAITSLYGAAYLPTITFFDLPVTLSNVTSSESTSTFDGTNSCDISTSSATTSTLTSATTSTSTASPTTGSGSFTNLNSLVQGLQTGLNSLLLGIARSDNVAAAADYNALSPLFDQLLRFTPSGSCDSNPTGKTLTQVEAIQLLQSVQSTLNIISLDVTNGDNVKALADTCEVRADYFNSGLHEFVFGPGQTSGTGH